LAYVAILFTVHVPWEDVFLSTLFPKLLIISESATMVVAIFRATIRPYLFFWQESREVEDMHIVVNKSLLDESVGSPVLIK
jgi:Mn2+/Fe2+ NRAMP family transporter